MRIKLFMLLLLTGFLPVLAQQSTVKGVVVDKATGKPIEGALVMINNHKPTI